MAPNLLAQEQMHDTLGLQQSSNLLSFTRLSLSTAALSRALQLGFLDVTGPHHISCMLPCRIQFALYCFRSLLLTASQLVSFPPGTKMLQFPGYPILSDQFRNPWLEDCMRLTKAYRSLPRPSSVVEPSYPLSGLHGSFYGTLAINLLCGNDFQCTLHQMQKIFLCTLYLHSQKNLGAAPPKKGGTNVSANAPLKGNDCCSFQFLLQLQCNCILLQAFLSKFSCLNLFFFSQTFSF